MSDTFYRSHTLTKFSDWYTSWHGYISLVVCLFGIITNVFNIIVLTRKHMNTPINRVLTWLAVSDILTMVSYVPFAWHFYCVSPSADTSKAKNSLAWMRFLLFYINFSATSHTVSIWLVVVLSVMRFSHIQSPAKGNLTRIRRLIHARIYICVVYAGAVVLLIPNYISNKLYPMKRQNDTIYVLEDLKLGTMCARPVVQANLWMYSILAKIVPCALMAIFGGLLLRTLQTTLRNQVRRLSSYSLNNHRPHDHSMTTRMLLVVMVLFIFTELPQGILIILSVSLKGFFDNVYLPLGDLMDIIALVNNAINFVLYCVMSQEFRRTFIALFWPFNANSRRKASITYARGSVSAVYNTDS